MTTCGYAPGITYAIWFIVRR
ncbi:MAG: hypothetical protein ACKVK8_11175 [Rhodospirillales bacterium]